MGVIERVIGVAEFEGAAREAVHALKYQNRHAISGLMGRLMADAAAEAGGSLVVHVALHSSRRRERGYDQAAMLSRHLARALSLPFEAKALVRVRKTLDQVQLAVAERKLNLENAFKCEARLHGENVLLVDDVSDSGRTLAMVLALLVRAGAEVRTVCLYSKPATVLEPDYVWRKTSRWIAFPWSSLPPVTA